MDWNDLRHFLALARRGSIRGAGAELGVSHTTVIRRVEALEEELAARLFDRHRDGFVLTEAGRRLLPAAARVEDEVAGLTRDLAGQDTRLAGPVRVTCGDEYLSALLVEELAPWCVANPGVELHLQTDGRNLNLAKGEADLAVRVVPTHGSPPDYLVGHRVAPLVVANYVGRAHVARLDPAGAEARWLGFGEARGTLELLRASSYGELPVWGAFTSLTLLVRAATVGLGYAMLPTYVGDTQPGLCRLPAPDLRPVAELWILHHPDLKANARVQGARAALRVAFQRRRGLFEGREPWGEGADGGAGGASAHQGGPSPHRGRRRGGP